MDFLGLIDIPLWVVLSIFLIILTYMYGKYPGTIWKRLGVPSPPSTLFFGHTADIMNPAMSTSLTLSQWAKQYGGIYGVLYFREPVLIISDPKALKEILVKDFNIYTDRYLTGGDAIMNQLMLKSVLFHRGDNWRRVRHRLTPSFSTGKLKRLTHLINNTAQHMVDVFHDHVQSATPVDSKTVFSAFSLDLMGGSVFGLEINSLKDVGNFMDNPFYQHAKDIFQSPKSAQLAFTFVQIFPFLKPLFNSLRIDMSVINIDKVNYFKDLVKSLMDQNDTADSDHFDLLQLWVQSEYDPESGNNIHEANKMTMDEIIAQSITFIFAGLDTISVALQWITFELARNPNVQQKMLTEIENVVGYDTAEVQYEHCQQLKYMDAVIKETLRMYPPAVTMARQLSKGHTSVCGVPVPPEVGIMVPVYIVGRDPELFEDPLTFNPDRFMANGSSKPVHDPLSFLSFGGGPRHCIGFRQALMQMKIGLVHMLRAVSIEGVSPTNVEEVGFNDAFGFLNPRQPLKLDLKRR